MHYRSSPILGFFLLALAASGCDPDDRGGGGTETSSTAAGTGSGGGAGGNGVTTGSGGAGGDGAGGSGEGGAGGAENTGPTWGESDPGVTVGPFGEFKAFRSGCGEQVWGRWIPLDDFALLVQTVRPPNRPGVQTTYFEIPAFAAEQKTVYLLGDDRDFGEGRYVFDFTVATNDGARLTHTLEVPIEPLFRWPGQFSFVSARTDPSQGLQLTLEPHISGDIGRIFVYDGESQCLVYSTTLLSQIGIRSGVTTEIDVGATGLQSGRGYIVLLQGVDDARQYIYYATMDMTAP